jgi:hypothetical protein
LPLPFDPLTIVADAARSIVRSALNPRKFWIETQRITAGSGSMYSSS